MYLEKQQHKHPRWVFPFCEGNRFLEVYRSDWEEFERTACNHCNYL